MWAARRTNGVRRSPKAAAIAQHNQISALFFWPRTYTQIRIHAKIAKVSSERSDAHFINRRAEKNALATISADSAAIQFAILYTLIDASVVLFGAMIRACGLKGFAGGGGGR